MTEMPRLFDIQGDIRILAVVVGGDVIFFAKHIGKMRLRPETEIKGNIKDSLFTLAQGVNSTGQTALTDVLAERDAGNFFEDLLHMPERVPGLGRQFFEVDNTTRVVFYPFTKSAHKCDVIILRHDDFDSVSGFSKYTSLFHYDKTGCYLFMRFLLMK